MLGGHVRPCSQLLHSCLLFVTGEMLGGHVRAVFTVITVLFVICVSATLTAFPELPLDEIEKGIGFADLVRL
jgi:hypothetical protein